MASSHLLDTNSGAYAAGGSSLEPSLDPARSGPGELAHLVGMNTSANTDTSSNHASPIETTPGAIEPVLTLAEIAAHLGVSVQTLYDLRNKGRGPRGFKVGRHLHFRLSEVDAWLRQLEAQDSCPAAARRDTPAEGPADEPAEASVDEAPGESAQELAGDQWALCLDVPRRL